MTEEPKSPMKKPSASRLELQQFKEGHIWRDLCEYWEDNLEEARETSDNEDDIFKIKKLQGAILVGKDNIGLIDAMIDKIEENQILDTEGDDDG